MRSLFIVGLILGAELSGCGALATLPPEPGAETVRVSETDASAPAITVARIPDGSADGSPVEASPSPEASAVDAEDAAVPDVVQLPPARACPATPPNVGDPCALPDSGVLRCEYAIDGGPCSTLAYCDGWRWGLGELIPADASGCY